MVNRVRDAFDVSVPAGTGPTREEIERQRFDAAWRQQKSFQEALARQREAAAQAQKRLQVAAQSSAGTNLVFVNDEKFRESLKWMEAAAIESSPIRVPIRGDVNGPSVLKAQILLDRANYSVGPIDGRWGRNSEIAVYWFQDQHGIEPTGDVDEATFRALASAAPGPALSNNDIEFSGKRSESAATRGWATRHEVVTPAHLACPGVDLPQNLHRCAHERTSF